MFNQSLDIEIIAVQAFNNRLFLWNEDSQKLILMAHKGFQSNIKHAMCLEKEEGYVGCVYTNRKPLYIGNVSASPLKIFVEHPDFKPEKSTICVPLEAWGRVMGVLCLHNNILNNAFHKFDLDLLSI